MIAILGWSSLIWKPQGLPCRGSWRQGGPVLPLEFTRVRTARPLTLVLDPVHGANCPTQFIWSIRNRLADAIADLQVREKAAPEEIGYVDLERNLSSTHVYPHQINISGIVQQWCQQEKVTTAVWTAIPPNFSEELKVDFSIDAAMQYFRKLSHTEQESVMEYVYKTPAEIQTPFRQRVEALWKTRINEK